MLPIRCVVLTLGVAVLAGGAAHAVVQDQADLAASLKNLSPVIAPDSPQAKLLPQMLSQGIKARRDAVNQRESKTWHELQTRADWEKYRDVRLEALRRSLGQWPTAPKTLKVRVTRTLTGDGFQIDNLVYESRPGLAVTASLYRPAPPRDKMPGLLICHSHHNPKTQGELQDMGMNWARMGCLVLVMDQVGHGERRQHPFVDVNSFPQKFQLDRQDYYFRYNVGMQLHLVGESLIGWMAWDMMRGVDLLYGQPGIDKDRIILLGAVAGGGDPAAVTAALDPRIACVAPFNFGGPQPETVYPLPADAETSFNYLGGGSWESTRGLHLSGSGGFQPWVIVGSLAPRRLIYGHEFAWDSERDPVWKRLQKIYAWYRVPENLAFATGKGSLQGKPPDSTHCNNIGPEHRQSIYAALLKWFNIPTPDSEYKNRLPAGDLLCLTPEADREFGAKKVHELAAELGHERGSAARARRAGMSADQKRAELQSQWRKLLGDVDFQGLARASVRTTELKGVQVRNVTCLVPDGNERQLIIPVRLLVPRGQGSSETLVVAVCEQGGETLLIHRAAAIVLLLEKGVTVGLPDLRGTGASKPPGAGPGRGSANAAYSASELMLGATLLGDRLRDLRAVLQYLRISEGLGKKAVLLWGDSLAAVNPAGNLGVPLDLKQPAQAEPLGGLVTLLTALYEKDVQGVYVRGGLASYQSVLESPFCHMPHDAIVPGALTAGDLPDLVAALAPRAVRLAGLVDGLNRRLKDVFLKAQYQPAQRAYQAANHAERLALHSEPATDQQLVQWFLDQVGNE